MEHQLEVFKSNLLKKPFCSDDLDCGLKVRNTQNALRMRYIQHNQRNSQSYLVFDVDYAISPCMVENELNLAQPNFFIQNPANKHAHIAYSLATPIHLNENSSQKVIRYGSAVENAYLRALNADAGYSGLIIKNPLHSHWKTLVLRSESYELGELAEYVNLEPGTRKKATRENYGLGRNCQLFDDLRHWAYQNIENYRSGSQAAWFRAVLSTSERFNCFASPLPYSEVKSTAKSVAGWTWRNYDGSGKIKRGRDAARGVDLDLRDKQVLAAKITNRQRVGATEEAIKVAIMRLQAKGEKVTIRAVAEVAGISKTTVMKHKELLT